MLLDLCQQGRGFITVDRDALIEGRQHPLGKPDIDDRAMDRGQVP